MNQKYAILLLHLNLFTQKLQLKDMKSKNDILFLDMYNRKVLDELYTKYMLYLVGDSDSKEILALSQITGVLPYVQDVFSLQYKYPLDVIQQKIHLTNPNRYLMCGRNLEHEIILANRCGMDSCYVGEQNYSNIISPTYHVQELADIKKVLKLR